MSTWEMQKEKLLQKLYRLFAGSPSIVSSLWNVDDKATAYLMDDFYKYLEKGKDIADALKMAQVDMIQKGYAPYYWASFILTGRY